MLEDKNFKFQNQYIRIFNDTYKINNKTFSVCAQLGKIIPMETHAGYMVELLDWTGQDFGSMFKERRTCIAHETAIIGWDALSKAEIIKPHEFYDDKIKDVINLYKDKSNKNEEAFQLTFKPTEELRALLRYLSTSTKTVGLVL